MNGSYLLSGAESYVAIDNKGLWPNLSLLRNGEIAAAVYNHPSHGFGCGNIELWISADKGRIWNMRSVVTDHSENPEFVRMNPAVGYNSKNELVVLCGGWSEGRQAPHLPIQICISADNGYSWKRSCIDNITGFPFGDVVIASNNHLICGVHDDLKKESNIYQSADNGATWTKKMTLVCPGDETAFLKTTSGKWLAAVRTWPRNMTDYPFPTNEGLHLYFSNDECKTWNGPKTVSLPGQTPGHLLELKDGNILLTYGSRIPGLFGVVGRISSDEGETWSYPFTLISIQERSDCGYPSSIQLSDGTVVTAWYSGPKKTGVSYPFAMPWHQRYHMGVIRWNTSLIPSDIIEEYPIPEEEIGT